MRPILQPGEARTHSWSVGAGEGEHTVRLGSLDEGAARLAACLPLPDSVRKGGRDCLHPLRPAAHGTLHTPSTSPSSPGLPSAHMTSWLLPRWMASPMLAHTVTHCNSIEVALQGGMQWRERAWLPSWPCRRSG